MGAPPNEEQMAQLLSDPAMIQTMNAALENPDFINHMIQLNPYLRNLPNARELLQSPWMRQMMTNPEMLRSAMRMQRSMAGGGGLGSSFPAPGATDNTPTGAPASNTAGNNAAGQNPNPFAMPGFPFMPPFGADFGASAGGGAAANPFLALFNPTQAQQPAAGTGAAANTPASPTTTTPSTNTSAPANAPSNQTPSNTQTPPNPFAALFGPPGQAPPTSPFGGLTPEMMQQMMQMWGPQGPASPASPAAPDNRPPEERYAEQLRQLNEMGFYDFDRNVAALRRSGGNVQGAIDHLLSG
jgi:ubiquilin